MFVEPEFIVHDDPEFEKFIVPVVIQRMRVLKARPKFNNWSLQFVIVITDERIDEDTLQAVLAEAGRRYGIGDWRPRFGTFEIVSFEHMKR
jgi:hypothetical protein